MTFRIAVLRSYLTILKQLLQPLLAGNETSLAVGSRVAVNAAKLRQLQPGRLIARYLHVVHTGNMASDRVEGQRRSICLLRNDGSVRYQTQLD